MNCRTMILTSLLGLFFILAALPVRAADKAAPSVVVSLRPIHSLVAGIMAGVGEPALIIKGSRSPHTYSLRPSDARVLSKARLVVWVGPGMERFLEKPLKALSAKSTVLTLVPNLTFDPHVWLSPVRAAALVERISAVLVKIDPAHKSAYEKNARALQDRLRALQDNGEAKLSPLREKPFMVFHDAWEHFATAFRLSVAGAVALNPDRPPGAKRITAIRRLIRESGARCLFREPQFRSPLLSTVLEGNEKVRVFELDPLGSTLPAGPGLYFKMMEKNLDAAASCLR